MIKAIEGSYTTRTHDTNNDKASCEELVEDAAYREQVGYMDEGQRGNTIVVLMAMLAMTSMMALTRIQMMAMVLSTMMVVMMAVHMLNKEMVIMAIMGEMAVP